MTLCYDLQFEINKYLDNMHRTLLLINSSGFQNTVKRYGSNMQMIVPQEITNFECFQNAENVDLSYCSQHLKDTDMKYFSNAKKLNLSGCYKITHDGLKCLKNITDININGCMGIKSLEQLYNVEHLVISKMKSLEILRKFKNLKSIQIRTIVNDEIFDELSILKKKDVIIKQPFTYHSN